jgi:hypothetical protein
MNLKSLTQQCCINRFFNLLLAAHSTKKKTYSMILTKKNDRLGAIASSLCLIHCLITPFIFVAQTCSITCCSSAPTWWRTIDIIFLIISFFAVYQSITLTTKSWLKISFGISWIGLLILILNDNFQIFELAHEIIYLPSLALIVLHSYNIKYCKCADNKCPMQNKNYS